MHKLSYEDMTEKINNANKKNGYKKKYRVKSIDNALSRIKVKGSILSKKFKW